MPPSTIFNKEKVLIAAYEILKESGLDGLSARNVAKRIGSSVAPVYSSFGSMERLEFAVIRYAKEELLEYCKRDFTDRPFLNIGLGVVIFARDYPNLYRSLFIDGNRFQLILDELLADLQGLVPTDNRLVALAEDERSRLLNLLWIFLHGHATLICSNLYDDDSDEHIIDNLSYTTETLVEAALSRIG